MSDDHFTVDGTLIEAWASIKSFRRKDEKPEDRKPPDDPGNPTVNFHGEKRSNDTHESKTDPESKLYRKGHNHVEVSSHPVIEPGLHEASTPRSLLRFLPRATDA